MKKSVSFIIVFSLAMAAIINLSACKKTASSAGGTYLMTYSNGTTTNGYITNASAVITSSGGQTLCELNAESADGATIFGIAVTSPTAINTTANYTDTSSINSAVLALQTTGGTLVSTSSYASKPNVRVNFTTITSTYVQGTFSGNMATAPGAASTAVIGGTFLLPIK